MTIPQTPRPLKHRRLAGVLLQNTTTHPGVAKIRIAIQQTLHKPYYTRPKNRMEEKTTAPDLCASAVNHQGGFGRRAFIEIVDTWDAKRMIALILTRS
jgi:hypothetical protein